MYRGAQRSKSGDSSGGTGSGGHRQVYIVLGVGLLAGYILGMVVMETADVMFTTGAEHQVGRGAVRLDTSSSSGSPTTASSSSSSSNAGDNSDQSRQQQQQQQEQQEQQQQEQQEQQQQQQQKQQEQQRQALESDKGPGDTIHSLLTSNGSPYQNFQGRIMYGTYKLVQKMPGGEKLTGFTRVLHRMKDDGISQEIPTFRATPLHPECDTYCDFPVADRPNAVQQWISAVAKDPSMLQGDWVLLLECDYVWMRPLQAPNAHTDAPGLQFHFDYIIPTWPGVGETLRRLMANHSLDTQGSIPPSGPAPALLRFWELQKVTPVWEVMTKAIEDDPPAVKQLGWVREMYAWDVAIVSKGVRMLTQDPEVSPLMVQPPHDHLLHKAAFCHYTWGAIYNDTQGEVFMWEKRKYTQPIQALKVPHIPMPPQPFKPNTWHLQGKEPVTKDMHETLTAMLGQMNKAIDTLQDLSGVVPH